MPWWVTAARWLCLAAPAATLAAACGSRGAESPTLAPQLICEGSYLETEDGKETGFAICSNGMRHRPKATACPNQLPRLGGNTAYLRTISPFVYELPPEKQRAFCLSDDDCTELPYGHCEPWLPPGTGTGCTYGCLSDSDCGAGELCLCGSPVGHCAQASCRTDADCKAGFVCGEYMPAGGLCGKGGAFACQTERDECAGGCKGYCSIERGRRTCTYDCGTP